MEGEGAGIPGERDWRGTGDGREMDRKQELLEGGKQEEKYKVLPLFT